MLVEVLEQVIRVTRGASGISELAGFAIVDALVAQILGGISNPSIWAVIPAGIVVQIQKIADSTLHTLIFVVDAS